MKSHKTMSNDNTVVKSGEFSFVRKPRKLKAYGEEFDIPPKTVELADKLDDVRMEIAATTHTSETVRVIKQGIALFIGAEKTEEIFPEEKLSEADPDEILAFWSALQYEFNRTQNELLKQYRR